MLRKHQLRKILAVTVFCPSVISLMTETVSFLLQRHTEFLSPLRSQKLCQCLRWPGREDCAAFQGTQGSLRPAPPSPMEFKKGCAQTSVMGDAQDSRNHLGASPGVPRALSMSFQTLTHRLSFLPGDLMFHDGGRCNVCEPPSGASVSVLNILGKYLPFVGTVNTWSQSHPAVFSPQLLPVEYSAQTPGRCMFLKDLVLTR